MIFFSRSLEIILVITQLFMLHDLFIKAGSVGHLTRKFNNTVLVLKR